MHETSWLRQILDNAERDVREWPRWLQKLRDGSSLDGSAAATTRPTTEAEARGRVQGELPMAGVISPKAAGLRKGVVA